MTAERRDSSTPDPAEVIHRVALSREQRDRISAAASTLEQHADHDQDPLAMLQAAAELRGVAAGWDAASHSSPVKTGPQPLREALRRIADGGIESSVDLDAHRADSDLDELDLGDDEHAAAA